MIMWGQSAGANAVVTYSYANAVDPIVKGLVAGSGAAAPSLGVNTTTFSTMASKLGCGDLSATDELSCMQKVDALKIQAYVLENGGGGFGGIGGMVADNVTAFANNTQRLAQGQIAKIPLITGVNRNEGAAFGEFSLNQTVGPDPADVRERDAMFVCGVDREANGRVAHNFTTYRYLFSGNFSNITPRYWLGAMHSSELPVVFGTHDIVRGQSTELEWQTSYAMQEFWVSFAANSSIAPMDHTGLPWPQYTGQNSSIIEFGNAIGSQKKPVTVMDEVYPLESC